MVLALLSGRVPGKSLRKVFSFDLKCFSCDILDGQVEVNGLLAPIFLLWEQRRPSGERFMFPCKRTAPPMHF